MQQGPSNIAIFAMKSFDTAAAHWKKLNLTWRKMPPGAWLAKWGDKEPAIAAVLGSDRVIAGTVTCAIARNAAGDIIFGKVARRIGFSPGIHFRSN